ncbi:MAG: PAS domain-containing protein, partial [Fimbriimonadaceae bacterium]|nr:PAS domain-containing protein [Alphaproteobacteria bacterium]
YGTAPSDLRQDDENTEKSEAPSSGAAALVAAVNNAFGQRNTAQSQSDDTLNIVPFRGHDDPAAPSPGRRDQAGQNDTEQDAFQAVADALSARLERGQTPISELSGGNGTETGPVPATGKNQPFGKMPDQAEWQSLLTRLPLAIFVYRGSNARGVSEPVFANRALLGMYGYGSLESIRQAGGVAAILPKSDAPRAHGKRFGDIAIVGDHMPSIDSSLSGDEGAGENGNLFIHDSSGVRIPVNARLQAVKWHGQNAMMLSVLKADGGAPPGAQIHDLQRRDQSVKLESILDQVLDAYLILDVEGIVKSMNRGAKALFAVEDTEILGKPFSGLLRGPSDQQAELLFAAIRDRLPASSFGDGCEIVAKLSGGADMPYFLKIHPIEKAGNSLFCAVFSDISRWKTVEKEQTDARQRAERDNELKSTFLTKISHEIRTPLNAILGFSDAILEGKFGALEHAQYREYVQNINEGGKHLLSLINDLLDLSKVEAGKMALDFTSVNLNEVAAASIKLMQSDANKARIIIRSNLMPNLADVVADVRSLRQICLNLLSNAIKFTGPGGQVIVASRSTEHGEVELRVQDTGTGMNNRELEAAMEPFQQLDNQLDDTPGTGLGLPLTKALVEENRARFEIHSSKGHGTLVKITFPVNRVLAD